MAEQNSGKKVDPRAYQSLKNKIKRHEAKAKQKNGGILTEEDAFSLANEYRTEMQNLGISEEEISKASTDKFQSLLKDAGVSDEQIQEKVQDFEKRAEYQSAVDLVNSLDLSEFITQQTTEHVVEPSQVPAEETPAVEEERKADPTPPTPPTPPSPESPKPEPKRSETPTPPPFETFEYSELISTGTKGTDFDVKRESGRVSISRDIALKAAKFAGSNTEIKDGTNQTITVGNYGSAQDLLKITRTEKTAEGEKVRDFLNFVTSEDGKSTKMVVSQEFLDEMRSVNPKFLEGIKAGDQIEVSSLKIKQNKLESVDLRVNSTTIALDVSSFFINAKDRDGNSVQKICAKDDVVVANNLVLSPRCLQSAIKKENGLELDEAEPNFSAHLTQLLTYSRTEFNEDVANRSKILTIDCKGVKTAEDGLEQQVDRTLYSVPVKSLTPDREVSYLNLFSLDGKACTYLHLKNGPGLRSKTTAQRYEIKDFLFEEPLGGSDPSDPGSGTVSLTLDISKTSSPKYVSIPMTRAQAIALIRELGKEDCDFAKNLPDGENKRALMDAARVLNAVDENSQQAQDAFNALLLNENNTKRNYQAYVHSYDDVANMTSKGEEKAAERTSTATVDATYDPTRINTATIDVTYDPAKTSTVTGSALYDPDYDITQTSTATGSATYDPAADARIVDPIAASLGDGKSPNLDDGKGRDETPEPTTTTPPVGSNRREPEPTREPEPEPTLETPEEPPKTRQADDDLFGFSDNTSRSIGREAMPHMQKKDLEEEIHPKKPAVRDATFLLGVAMMLLSMFIPGMQFAAFALLGVSAFSAVEGWNIPIRIRNARIKDHNEYVDSIDPKKNAEKIAKLEKDIAYRRAELENLENDSTISVGKKARERARINKLIKDSENQIAQAQVRTQIYENCGRYQSVEEYDREISQTANAAKSIENKYNEDWQKAQTTQNDFLKQCVEGKVLTAKEAHQYGALTAKIKKGAATEEDYEIMSEIQKKVVKNAKALASDKNFISSHVVELLGSHADQTPSGEREQIAADVEKKFVGFLQSASQSTKEEVVDENGVKKVVETGKNAAMVVMQNEFVNTRNEYATARANNSAHLRTLTEESAALKGLKNAALMQNSEAIRNAANSAIAVSQKVGDEAETALLTADDEAKGFYATTALNRAKHTQRKESKAEQRENFRKEVERVSQESRIEDYELTNEIQTAEYVSSSGNVYTPKTGTIERVKKQKEYGKR